MLQKMWYFPVALGSEGTQKNASQILTQKRRRQQQQQQH